MQMICNNVHRFRLAWTELQQINYSRTGCTFHSDLKESCFESCLLQAWFSE